MQASHVIDRMNEVDIDIVGTQTPQTSFKGTHHLWLTGVEVKLALTGQEDLITLALQRFADRLLRTAAGVALSGIKIINATGERLLD